MPHYTPKSQIIRVMRKEHAQSNLFLIRLWVDPESQGDEVRDGKHWHGKVQHMNSSMASSFQDWTTLKALLADMLDADGNGEGAEGVVNARDRLEAAPKGIGRTNTNRGDEIFGKRTPKALGKNLHAFRHFTAAEEMHGLGKIHGERPEFTGEVEESASAELFAVHEDAVAVKNKERRRSGHEERASLSWIQRDDKRLRRGVRNPIRGIEV